MDTHSTELDTPVELSEEMLSQVAGGLPRGTWGQQEASAAPSEQSGLPRGTW